MNGLFERFSLSAIMLLAVGLALFAALVLESSYKISHEYREMERAAMEQATAALDMLEAVHTSAMLLRKKTQTMIPRLIPSTCLWNSFPERTGM